MPAVIEEYLVEYQHVVDGGVAVRQESDAERRDSSVRFVDATTTV